MDSRFKVCYAKHKFGAKRAKAGASSGSGDGAVAYLIGSTRPRGKRRR